MINQRPLLYCITVSVYTIIHLNYKIENVLPTNFCMNSIVDGIRMLPWAAGIEEYFSPRETG